MDRDINAFVEVLDPTPEVSGPLSGLRFGVKEVIEQEGLATPLGVPFLGDRIGKENAEVVDSLLDAGARRLGTTRSTMLAIAGDSGARNPLDLSRSPGGSSAGSAAAVAAGFLDFALGTQTVGSIVRPASYCGVVGFKPTFDVLPTRGVMRLSVELDHVGLIARDVETAQRAFRALAGPRDGQGVLTKACLPAPWFDGDLPTPVEAACTGLAERLGTIGLAASSCTLPDDVTSAEGEILNGLLCKGVLDNHRAFIEANEAQLPAELLALAKTGARISRQDHAALRSERDRLGAIMERLFDDETVLVFPSVIDAPPKLGSGTGLREPQRLWTLLGWPAISIPFGSYGGDLDHLSVGVQLIARPGMDVPLLDLARRIEAGA
ncbi:Amidase [Salipiger mucosus DSM 16094]|uniref:Amidase n=1 Tax=Salipiger mucosus DSM 16094 TaxID=1123237 RepID=S9RBC0_9RHOB|nr:Amidase [Salipiger mucosus DSM 16094]